MEFNEYWTKEVNDKHRQFMKDNKSYNEIVEYFGKELLKHHSKKQGENITKEEFDELKNIVEKETEFNDIIPLMKNISYILLREYSNIKKHIIYHYLL